MYAKYTVVLKDIAENESTSNKLAEALAHYPLYEQKNKDIQMIIPTRDELNQRLINHYKYREIGFETIGRFLDELNMTMCEIMPHYNELYKTIEIMAELPSPFDNVDVTETYQEKRSTESQAQANSESSSNSTAESNTTATDTNTSTTSTTNTESALTTESESLTESGTTTNKSVKADTPQSELSIAAKNIDTVNYASEVVWNKDEKNGSNNKTNEIESEKESATNTSSSSSGSSTAESLSTNTGSTNSEGSTSSTEVQETEHTYTKKGNQGVNTYAHDMNEFRTSIIDVTNQIINDIRIAELFMNIF